MMDIPTLWMDIKNSGITLSINGDKLAIRPFSKLTDEHRREITQHKDELMRLIANAEKDIAGWRNYFQSQSMRMGTG